MAFLRLPKDARFSNKSILLFMVPIFCEQLLVVFMGLADTMMVSRSDCGENAVAALALVRSIDLLVKQVFIALSAGGSVVLSQYIGAENHKNSQKSLKLCVTIVFLLACVLSAIFVILRAPILRLLYPKVETDVMNQAISYFTLTAFSYPFMALYNAGCAVFRAMKNSRLPLVASVLMMGLNLIFKYIFIFPYHLGIAGAGLSSLIAFTVVGLLLVLLLHNRHKEIYIDNIFRPEWDIRIIRQIFRVGIPHGIENALFQVGAIVMQKLVSGLGTTAIAANLLGTNLTHLMYALVGSFNLGIVTFVGQCMGAGEPEEASMYTKHILKLDHFSALIFAAILTPCLPFIASLFGLSAEATAIAVKIAVYYNIFSILLYPESFALPSALRGAGDTKFTMYVSVISMFTLRIAVAAVLIYVFHLGLLSIWFAMFANWFVRGALFLLRFKQGRWKTLKVISK